MGSVRRRLAKTRAHACMYVCVHVFVCVCVSGYRGGGGVLRAVRLSSPPPALKPTPKFRPLATGSEAATWTEPRPCLLPAAGAQLSQSGLCSCSSPPPCSLPHPEPGGPLGREHEGLEAEGPTALCVQEVECRHRSLQPSVRHCTPAPGAAERHFLSPGPSLGRTESSPERLHSVKSTQKGAQFFRLCTPLGSAQGPLLAGLGMLELNPGWSCARQHPPCRLTGPGPRVSQLLCGVEVTELGALCRGAPSLKAGPSSRKCKGGGGTTVAPITP